MGYRGWGLGVDVAPLGLRFEEFGFGVASGCWHLS